MHKVHLSLLATALLAVNLTANQTKLEKITVTTASKTSQSLHDVTANVDVITADDIAQRDFITVPQVLSSVAGFSTYSNGGLGQSTSMLLRGFDSKRVLVLIDGVRYNDPTGLNGAQFEHLLTGNIAKIEVIKGAQSGVWGADASAGVINIITKKATKDGFGAALNLEYGSYNTQKYVLNTTYKQDAFDISFDAQRLSTDGFSAKIPEKKDIGDFEDDGYTNNTFNIKTGYAISDEDRIEAFFNIIDSDTDYDGYNMDPIKAANDANSTSSSKEQFYGLNYTKEADWGHIKLYAQKSKFQREYPNSFTKKYDGSIDEIGLNGGTSYNYFKGDISAGLDYKKFKHDNKIDKNYNNKGLFIDNTNTFDALLGGKTIFNEALRYDTYSSFNNKFTYKIGLKHFHEHVQGLWTSFNYATAYNVPTLFQLYSKYGNKNLKAETTKSYDVTINYKGLGITYFHNSIKDLLDYDTATFKYGNLSGKSKLSGVELSYENTIEAINSRYSFNYTYLKTQDNRGKELKRRANHTANLSFDYYGLKDIHIGAQIQYVGKRGDKDFSSYPAKDVTLKSYTLVNMIADYDVNDAFNIYAKVDNLLDKKYQQVLGYGTSERAFYAGLRYRF